MNYKRRMARIARHAARSRDTDPLIRRRVLEWLNLAVGGQVLERSGADAVLGSFDQLLNGISEAYNLDIESFRDGEPPLDKEELHQLIGLQFEVLVWTLDQAFAKKISARQYGPADNVVEMVIIRQQTA